MRFGTKKFISKERYGFNVQIKYFKAWKQLLHQKSIIQQLVFNKQNALQKKCFESMQEMLNRKRIKLEMMSRYRQCLLSNTFYEWRNLRTNGLADIYDKAIEFRNESLKKKVLMEMYNNHLDKCTELKQAREIYSKYLKKRTFRAFKCIGNMIQHKKNAVKMHKRMMFKYICHAYLHWKTKIQRLRYRRHRIIAEMNQWRLQRVLYGWRKITLTSQIEQEKVISAFQIYSKLRFGFDLLRKNTWKRKIIQFRRHHLQVLLRSWFDLTQYMKSIKLIESHDRFSHSKSTPSVPISPNYIYGSPDTSNGLMNLIHNGTLADYSTQSQLSPEYSRSAKRVRIQEDLSLGDIKTYRIRS